MSSTGVLITISSLSLVTSTASLVLLVVAGRKGLEAKKKLESEIESVKNRSKSAMQAMRASFDNFDSL